MESGEHPMWKNMDWEKEKAKDGKRDRQRASGKKKKGNKPGRERRMSRGFTCIKWEKNTCGVVNSDVLTTSIICIMLCRLSRIISTVYFVLYCMFIFLLRIACSYSLIDFLLILFFFNAS